MSIARPRRASIPPVLLFFCSVLYLAGAAELKIPPSPDRWVTDTADFLSPAAVRELDLKLEAYEQQTGHQVLIYIGKTTDGYPIEDFAAKAFEAWKVGRKGLDDGLVLFIMAEDRTIRIEVGYGLEGVVPDIIAGRIINDILIPKIRAGDPDGAVRDAVAGIMGAISGAEPDESPEEPSSGRKGRDNAKTIFIIIAVIIFLILFISNPSFALWLLINIMSGGGAGGGRSSGGGWGSGGRGGGWGGGGGGGGFRGGGGRSGGGGASGRW